MATEKFSRQEFEAALPVHNKTGEALWVGPKMVKGELTYYIDVTDTNKRIVVRSSIDGSGFAAETGRDSIRLWVEYEGKRGWRPLAKARSYTTRVKGWEGRMTGKLRDLWTLAVEDSQRAPAATITAQMEAAEKFVRPDEAPAGGAPKTEAPAGEAPKGMPAPVTPTAGGGGKFVPSQYQQDIMDAVLGGADNLQVVACPGSGKSTTLKWIATEAERAGQEGLVILTFAKALQTEMAEKMKAAGSGVPVQTCHSLGFGNNKRAHKRAKMDGYKVLNTIRALIDDGVFERDDVWSDRWSIAAMVDHLRYQMAEPTTEALRDIAARFGVDTNGDEAKLFAAAQKVYRAVVDDFSRFDFVDMIYWTASGAVQPQTFATLFIDESQDFNPAMIEFTLKTIAGGGRAIVVGDPNQSIYGFMGADTKAMGRFREALEARELPLSICYRCDSAIIEYAKEVYTDIEARENAAEGIVGKMPEASLVEAVTAGDLVLCRTNAPLVKACYRTIRAGKKAFIVGRDIGKGLINLINRLVEKRDVANIVGLMEALAEYERHETEKLLAADKDMAAQAVNDKCDTIRELSDGCYTIKDLTDRIKDIFDDSDDGKAVRFSTVHKAKGTEADRVFILRPELMPFPKARSEEDLVQERNIMWVARTRAKHELYELI